MKAAQALLSHCIDYAGLFPPAGLDLHTTIREYSRYHASPHKWALGRLILPASRHAEFRASSPSGMTEWPLSLLIGSEWENDIHLAEQLDVPLDVVESRPAQIGEIAALRNRLPANTKIYFEIPGSANLAEYITAIADAGAHAKIRTGGITQQAIPSAHEVARFLSCCIAQQVPFKATAGLHHALRGIYPLTYAPGSERALMHGFVNMILAASMLSLGGDINEAAVLLEDGSPDSFSFDDDCARWRDRRFTTQQIVHVRENLMMSFGSCSFTEPLDEMKQMRWL